MTWAARIPTLCARAAITPAVIPDLLRAWTPTNAGFSPAYGMGSPLTLSGAPVARAGYAPDDTNMVELDPANSDFGSFTSTGALAAFTFSAILAPRSTTLTVPLADNSAGGASKAYMSLIAASGGLWKVQARRSGGSAGNSAILDTTVQPRKGGCYHVVITYDGATGTLSYMVNGSAAATLAAGAGTFTFDRLFKGDTVFGSGLFGDVCIWPRVLTAGELATLATIYSPKRSTKLYVDSVAGDDTNGLGTSAATPIQTLTTALASPVLTNATSYGVTAKRGSLFVNQPITSAATVAFTAYGSGERPKHWGADFSTGFTSNGDGTWSKALAYTPNLIGWRDPSVTIGVGATAGAAAGTHLAYRKLTNQATSNPFSWQLSAGTLTIRLDGVSDPNSAVIIAPNNTTRGVFTAAVGLTMTGWDVRHWGGEGVKPTGVGEAQYYRDMICMANVDDDFAPNTSVGAVGCWIEDSTTGCLGIDGSDDAVSCHIGTRGGARRSFLGGKSGGGFRNLDGVTDAQIVDCYVIGNGQDVKILASTGTVGSHTVSGCTIVVTSASTQQSAVEIETGVEPEILVSVLNSTMINQAGTPGIPAIRSNGGTLTQTGNTQTGFFSMVG